MEIDELMKRDVDRRMRIQIKNPKEVLWCGMQHFLGDKAKGLPEYAKVAEWLGDNQQRGLMLMGDLGRGKTTIALRILPVIMQRCYGVNLRCVSAYDMNTQIDALKQLDMLVLDDVGVEGPAYEFGNRRMAFNEIVDSAERNGHLLIITTNLRDQELMAKYGERTMDRLKGMMHQVLFQGNSLRC